MNKYLSGSTLHSSSIGDDECIIKSVCKDAYKLNITKPILYKIFENSLIDVFDQIKIPLGDDQYKVGYAISNNYGPLALYKETYKEYNICRLFFDIKLNDIRTSIRMNLFCAYRLNKTFFNKTITDEILSEIIFSEPLFLYIKMYPPFLYNRKYYISYLNYLKSNCTFPIYFHNDDATDDITDDILINPYHKIELDDFFYDFFKMHTNIEYIYYFKIIFPKNNRNVIDK